MSKAPEFALRGVYFHDGFDAEARHHAPLYWTEDRWRRQVTWLHACGINAVEFATMLEWSRIPSTTVEHDKIAARLRVLDLAHELGLGFGYLLSNTLVSTVPDGEAPGHQLQDRARVLCPRRPGNFEQTLAIQRYFVETYREADFFEEFAADWGGCPCGECGVPEYMRYVEALAGEVTRVNRRGLLYADTWCISYWGPDPISHGWRTVFDREITGSREVIAAIGSMPANVGLALPCHHLYRPLAFDSYGGRAATPVFPTAADLAPVLQAGRPILAWPHFVMDDDAARARAWGKVHSEVRYVRQMLLGLRSAGIDRVMGNLYLPGLQLPNTYAFGRLTAGTDLDPSHVLADFAAVVAHPADVGALTEVLMWLENGSYWQQQLPPDAREPDYPCSLSREAAATLCRSIRANPSPSMPLPVAARDWLDDLVRSVEGMDWA